MSATVQPPEWCGASRVLLHSGAVYSPADPFATAMLVVGSEVAWIGSDGAALVMADGVDEAIDLAGALVTPAAVDAHVAPVEGVAAWRTAAAGLGIGLGHLINGRDDADPGSSGPGPLIVTGAAVLRVRGGLSHQQIAEHIATNAGEGKQPVVDVAAAHLLPAALHGLQAAARVVGATGIAAAGTRVDLVAAGPGDAAALAACGASVCALHSPRDGFSRIALAALAAEGVPLSFGSAGPDPMPVWEAVAAAVNHPDPSQRISARAAFAATTRGGQRAVGHPAGGVLVPGAPAHYAVWEAGELAVQAPDERLSAWSTDPRSGTPGLPDVSGGTAPPRCLRTVVWGRTIFPG